MTIFGLVDTGISSSFSALAEAGAAPNSQSWGAVWGALAGITPTDNPGVFMKLGTIIGNADSYVALLWASLSGVTVAIILTLIGKIMKLGETIGTLTTGFKTMLPALIILTLAWSLAATTDNLHTATFLTSSLADSLNPYLVPVIIFILSALISFSTGSSWSTMAILYPIAIPTTWAIGIAQGMAPDLAMELLLNVIAVTLAASVLGDHCSPISDTTILSSLASDCNHIDHVRTQLPYALTVGGVSLVANGISTLLGGGWLICFLILLVSIVTLYIIVLRVGKLKT
jgi:Na+/H+ antiporter NhaC